MGREECEGEGMRSFLRVEEYNLRKTRALMGIFCVLIEVVNLREVHH